MKIQTTAIDEIERYGVGTDRAFSIKFDAKMAKILADGLYSDKIKSVIRELSCNAYDSHVEAGKAHVPFEVHIPNNLEPWFEVKDFGVGLSDQQILDIYTCYGVSTKTNSNAVIGQLGLGSKSPFSLTDAFNVSARKDGIENHYSMYKDEYGMPSVAHLGSNPTTDPNGVTVKVPVRNDQRSDFVLKAGDIYKWFPVKPVITGASQRDVNYINSTSVTKAEFEGNEWAVCGAHSKSIALMGTVAYPLQAESINGITRTHRQILQAGVVLKFNIGDLEVAANREAIGYDERTCANILAKLDLLIDELGAMLKQKLTSATTEWEAQNLYEKVYGYSAKLGYVLRSIYATAGVEWNGIILSGAVHTKVNDLYAMDADAKKILGSIGCLRSGYSRAHYITDNQLGITCSDNTVIVFNDLERGGIARIYNHYRNKKVSADLNHKDLWIFSPSTSLTWDEMKAKLGNPQVIFTSSLPKTEVKRATAKVLHWTKHSYSRGLQSEWKTCSVDLENGGFYVDIVGWDVQMFGKTSHCDMIRSVLSDAKLAGIIDSNVEIYAMRKNFKATVQKNPKWKELFSYVKDQVEKNLVNNNVIQVIADHDELNTFVGNHWNSWDHDLNIQDQTSPMLEFDNLVRSINHSAKALNKTDRALRSLCYALEPNVKPAASCGVAKMARDISARYPMLSFLKRHTRYDNTYKDDIRKAADYINFVDATDAEFRREELKVA